LAATFRTSTAWRAITLPVECRWFFGHTFDPGATLSGPVYAIALPPSVIAAINRNAVGNSNEDDQILNLGNYTSGTLNVNYDMFIAPDDMRIFYGDTNAAAGPGFCFMIPVWSVPPTPCDSLWSDQQR